MLIVNFYHSHTFLTKEPLHFTIMNSNKRALLILQDICTSWEVYTAIT